MDHLNKLVHFLDKNGRLTGVVEAAVSRQSHVQKLLKHLKKNRFTTTSQTSRAVFDCEADPRLAKTKTLLKQQLVNGILIKSDSKMAATTECHRLFSAGLMLWRNGGRDLAIPLLESAFKKALKAEELDITLMIAEKLSYYYGSIEPCRNKWKH